jgi:hypothetical protein
MDKNDGDSGDAAYIDLNNSYMNNFVTNYEATIEKRKVVKPKKQGLEEFIEE